MDLSNDWKVQLLQAKASQQPQPSSAPAPAPALSQVPAQSASSSSAPGIPVKAAPTSKNPSTSSAPRNDDDLCDLCRCHCVHGSSGKRERLAD